jgi:hypothetical protein
VCVCPLFLISPERWGHQIIISTTTTHATICIDVPPASNSSFHREKREREREREREKKRK